MPQPDRNQTLGTFAAFLAFLVWGVLPLYWRVLDGVPALELLAHRIAWAAAILGPLIIILARGELFASVRDRRAVGIAVAAGMLLSANWFIYIWSIEVDRLVEASLGYYINPLVSVFLGVVFLRERLTRIQIIALILAGCGVLVLAVSHGRVPWISLALAVSFGVYGLMKKIGKLGSFVGLFVELWLVAPVAVIYLLVLQRSGTAAFASGDMVRTLLMAGAGIVTVVPLLLFGFAARSIPLSRVGFFQYLAPTAMLVIGTLLFGEPFTGVHVVSFSLIWLALILYTVSLFTVRPARTPASHSA